ncbi:MAG: hypothetical protein LBC79_02955 [Deltaproteobacteria bacterium]|jgi:hypothetical protein|nr:hypothetical protein [Deltaproteobacteria bacterium]
MTRSALAAFACAACMVFLAVPAAGAEECALARRDTQRVESSLAYPRLGHAPVDAVLARFAAQELERRALDVEEEVSRAASGQGRLARLEGRYTLFRPSPQAVSVLFELHATSPLWPAVRRYFAARTCLLPAGEELTLAGVFENVPEALKVLARKCPPKLLAKMLARHTQERVEMAWFLRTRLIVPGYPMPDGADMAEFSKRGGDAPAMRLLEGVVRGTRAEAKNYKHLVLTPEGVRIQFDPLQLGGPEEGAPHVDLSLRELQDARPRLALWGK